MGYHRRGWAKCALGDKGHCLSHDLTMQCELCGWKPAANAPPKTKRPTEPKMTR